MSMYWGKFWWNVFYILNGDNSSVDNETVEVLTGSDGPM